METSLAAHCAAIVTQSPAAITIAILAMGGEGGGVLADWIIDLAEHAGYFAQKTSVPGVAQRTGATIYYCEMFPEAAARAAGREPVLALMPVPGELDVVIASELMECGRAVQRGLVTPDRTTLITSTHRVYSISEKADMGDGRVDSTRLIDAARAAARAFVHCDFARIAAEADSVISAPLFGALAATGALPFPREQFEDAIRRGAVGVTSSLTAFAEGFAAALRSLTVPPVAADSPPRATAPRVGIRLRALAQRVEKTFPPVIHAILLAGVVRVADYQDERYAAEYLDRLDGIRDLDTQFGSGDYALLRETARYLALWMAYEDAIRVADLKIRRTRFERVREEVRAGDDQLVQINDYLHPRIDEIADVLPVALGRWLLRPGVVRRLVERVTRKGMVVNTTSLRGFLRLYVLASLRPLRRRSLRFRWEQQLIASWLAQIPPLAREDYALACEVAVCPRLVKGYGDTHRRGSENFAAVLSALPRLRSRPDAPERLKRLREAALADDTGEKLEQALAEVT